MWVLFFENPLKDILNIPENELAQIKMKLRNTCEKYCNINCQIIQRT